jgi:transposase
MKKFVCFFAFVLSVQFLSAQDLSTDEVQYIRQALKSEKKDLVKQYMTLSEAESAKFWPLYDEFQNQRAGIAKERLQIIKDYSSEYKNLSDDQAKGLAKRAFSNDKANLKLKEKYFKKFSKAVGSLKAAQYIQMEDYFQTLVRYEVQDAIPFIGEIERKKVN